MSGRIRTTKQLARRIDKEYYKKLALIPHWRRVLSWLFAGLALSWIGWHALARDSSIYSGGLTKAHASFAGKCSACHNDGTGVARTVVDTRCLHCHDGPAHNARQVSTPACVECHVEHRGREMLLSSSDEQCTRCHSDLHTKDGAPKVAAAIHSFADGHPEFKLKDPGQIQFSHRVHLKKDLRGAAGKRVQLQCGDCHQPAGIDAPATGGFVSNPRPSRAYMAPVKYAAQCASCHPLEYDRRMADSVPHQKPEVVDEFLIAKFGAYIKVHPEELRARPEIAQRIPRQIPEAPAGNAREWVALRVAESERLLWTKTCVECHRLIPAALPRVVPSNLTARWLKNGNFDHAAHTAFGCESCHNGASMSEKAADVLIPGVAVCRQCHSPSGDRAVSAGSNCVECHQYHDWSKEKAATE
jgi:hypothetical protein